MDGLLIIDKPAGITSHDVVDEVRRILRVRRVGHTGTLDPFATGVLGVLVGRATRLAQFLTGLEKEYEAVIRLGYATDTGDKTGKKIDATNSVAPWDASQIEAALDSLRGEIQQTPPMYSAKKKDGRKLYELARRGEEIEREPVSVCIHEFVAIKTSGEFLKDNSDGTFDLKVRVVCSSGTYIRTLAEDFGKRLQVGAHLTELRRTRAGDFRIQHANTLGQLKVNAAEESIGKVLLPLDAALSRFPFFELESDDIRRVQNGIAVKASDPAWNEGERVRLRNEAGDLIAVGTFDSASGSLHPSVVIAREDS
jgi:tRNA pseudouridine55 synthase